MCLSFRLIRVFRGLEIRIPNLPSRPTRHRDSVAVAPPYEMGCRVDSLILLMFRFTWPAGIALWVLMVANGFAQSPAPSSASPAASSIPTPAKSSPTPSPSATPTTEELIDSLGAADLQAVITLLKNNFTNPDAITETELNRATIEGLMIRLSHGVMLLPPELRGEAAPGESSGAFYSEILDGHAGYLRLGAFTTANLQAMDKKLGEFSGKKIDALIIDLRDSPPTNDFATAAEFAKRFCPKGKPLFTLRKPAARQDRVFSSDREPAFQGLIMVLADGDTAGGAETLAGALRFYNKALIIGQPTAGRAVEYSDLQLPSGKVLRIAVAEAVLPEGRPLFPDGVKPDLPVEMSMADKRQIFQLSAQKGMGPFVYETERPHLNEAALLAGTNPELDAAEAAQERRRRPPEKPAAHDPVLQRAIDVVTSLEIYQKR
jgi:Peptidase family S41